MFTKPSYRKRVAITCFFCFIGQSTASKFFIHPTTGPYSRPILTNKTVLVINNYGPTFYGALGYGTTEQLLLQAGWVTVAPVFCFVGAVLMDPVGRKPCMLTGVGGCCFWLIVEACAVKYFTGHPERESLGKLGVAALYLFNVFYNLGVDVGGNVYYAEVFPNHIRSKGVALANLVLALTDLVYLQVTPYAFNNIGWRYFLVSLIAYVKCVIKADIASRSSSFFLVWDSSSYYSCCQRPKVCPWKSSVRSSGMIPRCYNYHLILVESQRRVA